MEYLIILTVLLFGTCWCNTGPEWGYSGEYGPDNWYKDYPMCGMAKQSPIDIEMESTEYDKDLGQLQLSGFDSLPTETNYTILNNGHTIEVTLENAMTGETTTKLTVQGGGLHAPGYLLQFHLHWGSNNINGSEHAVHETHASGEIHFVFINKIYADSGDAFNSSEGFEVIGVFIMVGDDNNDAFDVFLDNFDAINTGNSTPISAFEVGSLFPDNTDDFYRYMGSFTTPGCNEVVVWTILKNGIKISQAQLDKLREYVAHDGHVISNNARPTQPLNGRVVKRNFAPMPDVGTPSPMPDGGTPSPMPDGGTPSPMPDVGTPSPMPDVGTPSPMPDGGTPSPMPDGCGPGKDNSGGQSRLMASSTGCLLIISILAVLVK